MCARELRLRRAFRCIVTATLAGPIAVGAACHAGDGVAPVDASAGGKEDAGALTDATTRDASLARDSAAWDPEACAAVTIDGAYIDNSPDGCSTFRALRCGLPPDPSPDEPPYEGCNLYLGICPEVCPAQTLFCLLSPVSCTDAGVFLSDAEVIVDCVGQCGIAGRPPRGLRSPGRQKGATPLGAHFATMAHMEAASVRAFRDLERSLAAHGAPVRLRRAARRAAADERRHARVARRLALRFGGAKLRVRVAPVAAPSLVELLEDDAAAGCVDETFAALLATWQASHATDPCVRRAMGAIAADETRHAALAWEVLHWGLPRLDEPDRARVLRAMDAALARLGDRAGTLPDGARAIAGNPTRAEERRLARQLSGIVRKEANASA
jgi:hypothetical protein